jgi:hypothetical protein
VRLKGLGKLKKNFNERDLPASRIVYQPTTLPQDRCRDNVSDTTASFLILASLFFTSIEIIAIPYSLITGNGFK